jgi:hypothetical protein
MKRVARSGTREIRILFTGPPGPVMPQFVEVEDEAGRSVNFGEWHRREDGSYWELRIPVRALRGYPKPPMPTPSPSARPLARRKAERAQFLKP